MRAALHRHQPYRLLLDGEFGGLVAGEIVYPFFGATYGCISPEGHAMTRSDGEYPFFEVSYDNLAEAA